jgi:cytochrome c-type biogenesis protein CcmH/NrfG
MVGVRNAARKLLELDPANVVALDNLSIAEFRLGNMPGAKEALLRLRELQQPEAPWLAQRLRQVEAAMDNPKGAVKPLPPVRPLKP